MIAPNLLTVANIPSGKSNILDWCPFANGDDLDTIVNNINDKLESEAKGWDPIFQPHLQYIDVCMLELPPLSDCEHIHLFLIDLDAAQTEREKLEKIRSCMHHMISIHPDEHIHLGQVGRPHRMSSLKDFFPKTVTL